MMMSHSIPFVTEQQPQDQAEIETLLDLAFGIGRRTKTSYRLRDGNVATAGLSLVVREAGFGIVGSISFWPILIGEAQTPALLLGPLAITHNGRSKVLVGRCCTIAWLGPKCWATS